VTIRAIILGLLLGLFIAGATYFNDAVVRQTYLIGNHFPIGVFGVVLLLLVTLNPLLGALRDRSGLPMRRGALSAAEICLIAAIGLAACSWPSSNFYRVSTSIPAMPADMLKNESAWKSANAFSYLPGGSAKAAEGHVQDWAGLLAALRAGRAEDAGPLDRAIWDAVPQANRRTVTTADADNLTGSQRFELLTVVNDHLIAPVPGTTQAPPLHAVAQQADALPPAAQAALAERDRLLDEADALAPSDAADAPSADTSLDRELAGLRAQTLRGEAEALGEQANRLVLVDHWSGVLLPPPQGEGLLVTGGRPDDLVIGTLVGGRPKDGRLSLTQLPWEAWWPTIRLWGGAAMLLALASLCLSLIVHPQWAHRELLTYPIAKFLEEASARQGGGRLPDVARSKLFWIGVGVPVLLHTVNGLHTWFPPLPDIPLELDFTGLRKLFPNASKAPYNDSYFKPTLYLTVIAFAFFLSAKVSFSLGVSQLLFVILGAILIANGQTLDNDYMGAKKSNLLRFGGYLGITLMILYTGRRYYLNVAASAVGLRRGPDTPNYAPWAARGLAACVVLAVVTLGQGGLSWPMASLFVLLVLMTLLVMSRICAETGLFFNQAWWMPVGVLTALLGVEAIGPTTYIVLAIGSAMLIGDPREALMPYLTNALKLGDNRAAGATPARVAPILGVMIVVAFLVAGSVTMFHQYNDGFNAKDKWAQNSLPGMPFSELSKRTKEMGAAGTLADATAASGVERLSMILPEQGAVPWMLIGAALVLGAASARLRLPWWPLHPVAFLVWGTFPMRHFAFPFLVGWAIKLAVTRTAGAKGYHDAKPLMVGVIAGELFMALAWMIVGAAFFYWTGKEPLVYRIFPG